MLAENFVRIKNFEEAKEIYTLLKKLGENYRWHSAKQLALIDIEKSQSEKAIHELEKGYRKLSQPNVYQTFDFAQF